MSDYDYLFKVILLGEEERLLKNFLCDFNLFRDRQRMTIGVDFGIKVIDTDGYKLKLQIWIPATQERFSYIRPLYYRGASSAILITNQTQIQNLRPYINELMSNLGPIPINFVIRCSSQFVKAIEEHGERLQAIGILPPLTILDSPQDIYQHVAHNFLSRHTGYGWGARLSLLIDDQYPWNFIAAGQTDFINTNLNFLEEQLSQMANWSVVALCQDAPGKQLDEAALMRQLELYYEIIESIGAKIDDYHLSASVRNSFGLFEINLHNGEVHFIPDACFSCEKKCHKPYKSLCIVRHSGGWSNSELSKKQLLIIAKIFAIQSEDLPNHIWNQINGHRAYCSKDCGHKPPRETPPYSAPATIRGLRDAMLQELHRLREIMLG